MITPNFKLSQDDENLTIEIEAAHGELASFDLDYGGDLLHFSCSPYYLRLHLTGQIVDFAEGKGHISHDVETGIFKITAPKKTPGQFFPRLEMITELLRPQKPRSSGDQPMVEEIDGEDEEVSDDEIPDDLMEQELPAQNPSTSNQASDSSSGYGFAWRNRAVLEKLAPEIKGLCDLLEPSDLPIDQRVKACILFDAEYFDPDRYLVDNFQEDYQVDCALSEPFRMKLALTGKDRSRLKDLPKRKLPKLSQSDAKSVAFGLFDLLMAFSYDQRVNNWASTCMSGKNIVKMSPTLTFHVKYDNLKEAVIGVARRILTFALYRNWNLAAKALDDAREILRQGPTAVVHALCKIHQMMITTGEFHYLINDLYITEYLVWIQSVDQKLMKFLLKEAEKIQIQKSDIPFDLASIEEEVKIRDAAENMNVVNLDSDDNEE
ncbi:hypothetical protein WR25_10124 [Diploscapter pachys]|uniref:Protein SHQ1 homolog n=1 Tax=Diploscapter pachys TaxID=2018661 RepID=A0A2A2LEP8_9BILA|nr:hypothetical protein WR25_10124 [Diploscapter pachys]